MCCTLRISRQPFQLQIEIGLKQLEIVEYFKYLDSLITSGTRYKREIKAKISMEKAAFNRKKTFH
jgi:hypothetical protein